MKKILFVARLAEHIRHFHLPYINWMVSQGYQVDLITIGDENINVVDNHYKIPMDRDPLTAKNIKAYRQLKYIIDKNDYDLIHCHMPLTGILTRIAARHARTKGTKVLYTAHGFHFFKGAPLINWLVYYPAEKIVSNFTDCIITINQEDYHRAKRHFYSNDTVLIDGVGINTEKYLMPSEEEKHQLRKKYDINRDTFVLIYVAELSYRKHQDLLIESIKLVEDKIPDILVLLAGKGDKNKEYEELINQLNLSEKIKLLGYRNDIDQLMMLSDVVVSTSRQEGLPVNIMEAMGTGLPAVVTDCRGNKDLVRHEENGLVVQQNDPESLSKSILRLYNDPASRDKMGIKGKQEIDKYSIDTVLEKMKNIYNTYL